MGKTDKNPVSEIEMLAATITEGSKATLRNMLSEAVRNYLKEEVLNEDDDEMDDENMEDSENVIDAPEFDDASDDAETAEEAPEEAEETAEVEDAEVEETDGDEWSDFDDYKVDGDDDNEEYDFTSEKDPEKLVRVFKLMKNDDKVSVVQNGDMITVKDDEAETEYVIDLGGDEPSIENNEFNGEMTMESLGYTDNYQDKDPIEGLSMDASAPKNTNDWHKGVPTGTKKPWAGKGNSEPFGKKAEKVFEITLNDEVEEPMEEATNVGGFVQQNTTTKSHVPNSSGRKARNMSKGGEKVSGTADPRYSGVNEELQKKVDTALAENKKLKETVAKVSKIMKEAVQVNVNLGHIVRLMVENTTTKAEKEDIVKRYSNVKTNDEATALYESITNELKKAQSTVINEDIKPTEQPKSINESKIYTSNEANDVLDMMRRMNML
jgi:hypothetical protein